MNVGHFDGNREGREDRYDFRNLFFISIIFSGISRLRGVVMYELQSTLSTYAKRKYSSGEISVEHLKNILKVKNPRRSRTNLPITQIETATVMSFMLS